MTGSVDSVNSYRLQHAFPYNLPHYPNSLIGKIYFERKNSTESGNWSGIWMTFKSLLPPQLST